MHCCNSSPKTAAYTTHLSLHQFRYQVDHALTPDEIIAKLCGGDQTKGSCSSLGFAYAGNHVGLDVTDFRGGESQNFFSMNSNIVAIAKLPNCQM